MKTRLCFVSNSSSSSYLIITTPKSYDNVMKQLSELERKAVQAEFSFDTTDKLGKDLIVCHTTISTEDIGSNWDFLPEDGNWDSKEFNEAYDGISKFYGLISKQKDTYTHNEGC